MPNRLHKYLELQPKMINQKRWMLKNKFLKIQILINTINKDSFQTYEDDD